MNYKRLITLIAGICALISAFGYVGAGDFQIECVQEYQTQGYSSPDCAEIIEEMGL